MERVMGFTQPLLESILSGALLTNAVGGVAADALAFHAVPGAATEYASPLASGIAAIRVSADGSLAFFYQAGTNGYGGTGRFALTPQNFYVGAVTFEQGNPYQPIVGRVMAQPDVVNWRLSNGLVRVTPNAAAGKLDVSHYNGTSWSAVKTYDLQVLAVDSATDAI